MEGTGDHVEVVVEEAKDIGVDLALDDILHHLDGLLVGHAQAADEVGGDAGLGHGAADGLAAAVHQDDLDADSPHEGHVAQQAEEVVRRLHDAAADLDDHEAPAEVLDVRHGLDEDVGLLDALLNGGHVVYSALIFTYSKVRSQVKTVSAPLPSPSSTSTSKARASMRLESSASVASSAIFPQS